MSLRDTLLIFAQEIGRKIDLVPAERLWCIDRINEAAEEIYNQHDLPGSLRELTVNIDATLKQITIPWYVYKLRGVRFSNIKQRIDLHDMRPRYATEGWRELYTTGYRWRVKHTTPIAVDLTNGGPLTLTLGQAEDTDFTVSITGQTALAARVNEVVTFSAGDTTKTTTNSFIYGERSPTAIETISKSIQTLSDLTIADVNGNTLSIIPNSEFKASYTLVQILDLDQSYYNADSCNCVEILFKIKFSPFLNDGDEFISPGYDKILAYKALERYYLTQPSKLQLAAGWNIKVNSMLAELAEDDEDQTQLVIDFGKSRGLNSDYYQSPYYEAERLRRKLSYWRGFNR